MDALQRLTRVLERRSLPLRSLQLLLVLCAAAGTVVIDAFTSRATAAPPLVRPRADQPFDDDWLTISLILKQKCVACHRRQTEQIPLQSYRDVTERKASDGTPLIVPGQPDQSALWESVAWNARAEANSDLADSPLMPEDHLEWLSAGQLDTLRRWIERGALEYKLPATCSPRPLLEIDFPSARECRACHPKQYSEWSRSMHAYAQVSPTFEAFNLTLQERTSGTIGTFCSRCHTPQGTALGENGLLTNVHRSRISREGVTCVVCHRQAGQTYKANGRQALQTGQLSESCLYGPFADPVDSQATGTHAAAGSSYLLSSEFCGSCHDVTSPTGVRLEEAFSEWKNSPAGKQGITCQECHMGPVQGQPIPRVARPLGRAAEVPGIDPEKIPLRPLSDHTFAGPDYCLLPDTEFPHQLDWMYEQDYTDTKSLTPYQVKSLRVLRQRNRASLEIARQKRYELLHRSAKICVHAPDRVTAGSTIRVRVEVTNLVSGHYFPTGFTAERQLWVSITLHDPRGKAIFCSGDLDSNGDLRDSHSHAVETGHLAADHYLLNFQNKFSALTQQGTDRQVILSVNRHLQPVNVVRPARGISASFGRPPTFRIAKGSLPPLATVSRTYPMRLPDLPGPYTLQVQLNFRHLPPTLLDAIAVPHLKHLLEVVVIDAYQGVIEVGG